MIFLQTLIYGYTLIFPANLPAQQLGRPTVDGMIGINTRPQDHPLNNRIGKFNHVRTFHPWSENVDFAASTHARRTIDWPNTPILVPTEEVFLRYRYNFSFNGNSNYSTDDFYQNFTGRVSPTMKDLAPEMRGLTRNPFIETPHEQKPVNINVGVNFNWNQTALHVPAWGDLQAHLAPEAYRSYALQTTMFAARYGGRKYKQFSNYYTRFILPHLKGQAMGVDYEQSPLANGLNSVDFMEIYNEPEKEWRDNPATLQTTLAGGAANPIFRQTLWRIWPEEYAAMISAAADGHCRDLDFEIQPPVLLNEQGERAFLGIRNADPGMRIVAGGLADLRGAYFEEVFNWCQTNRLGAGCQPGAVGGNRVLPFDILNVHHYSTLVSSSANINNQYTNHASTVFGGHGVSPEEDDLRFRLRYFALRLRGSRPAYAEMPIWFSEFGYDHAGASQITVPEIAGQTRRSTQAQWLMRALLEVNTSGVIDRADLYEIRDDPNGGEGLFNTCGLVNRFGTPKESWYFVQTLRNVLSGYRYTGVLGFSTAFPDLSDPSTAVVNEANWQTALHNAPMDGNNGNPSSSVGTPRMYRFARNNSNEEVIFAVWNPSSDGTRYDADITVDDPLWNPNTQLSTQAVSLIRTVNLNETGVWQIWTNTSSVNGRLTISNVPVSETPLFIVLGVARTSEIPTLIPPGDIVSSDACCGDISLRLATQTCTNCVYRIYYGLEGETAAVLDPPTQMYYFLQRQQVVVYFYSLAYCQAAPIAFGLFP
jgi:hypothetical protein